MKDRIISAIETIFINELTNIGCDVIVAGPRGMGYNTPSDMAELHVRVPAENFQLFTDYVIEMKLMDGVKCTSWDSHDCEPVTYNVYDFVKICVYYDPGVGAKEFIKFKNEFASVREFINRNSPDSVLWANSMLDIGMCPDDVYKVMKKATQESNKKRQEMIQSG